MISLLGRIPRTHFHVACSGGSDSMVLVDFLMRFPKNKFDLLYFNHGTECCDEAEEFVKCFASKHNLTVHIGKIASPECPKGSSIEDYWRNCRYSFLSKFSSEPILMAHHLNDCIETWIMSSMCGKPLLIPYCNPKYNVIRPFLTVPKSEIRSWAKRNKVEYVTDKSNFNTAIRRNYVRHVMMEHVYELSPGIETIVKKKVLAEFNSSTERH